MKNFKSNIGRGFTLIELLGVMAIIGVLAAVTLPSMISKIESARTENEDANLQEIARALAEGIKKRGQFPNPTLANGVSGSWTDIAQNYTSLGPDALANVIPIGNPRRIVFSDDLTAYLGGAFTQPAAGRPVPAFDDSLIIYILSSSKNGLPLLTGILPADIANWTKAFDATLGYIRAPTSVFGAANVRKGEFLHVKALDVRSLLCRVDLTDTAAPENIAGFNIAVGGVGYTPSSSVMVSYLNNNITFRTLPADTFTDSTSGPYFNGTWDTVEAYTDINGDLAYNNTGALNNTIAPTLSLASSYNARHEAIPNTVILPGTAQYAGPASPNAPTYDLITAVGPGAGGFLPSPDLGAAALGLAADHNQTVSIYVIKGSSINLFNGAGVLDKSVVIQSDVQYKYFNNSWTRVD